MDPNIETEQLGPSPGAHKADDRADYLRRLKAQASDDAPPKLTSSIAVPAVTSSSGVTERRRRPRLPCSGSAEFRPEGSDVRMWGALTDVSLHGCYVEMNNTFPTGTRGSLTIEALGIRVRVPATVRLSYPFLGMGMCFSEIEPGQQSQLEQLLATLSGQSSIPNSAPAAPTAANPIHSLADVDSTTMADQLTEFFRSNNLLSRDEFYRIAKRARR